MAGVAGDARRGEAWSVWEWKGKVRNGRYGMVMAGQAQWGEVHTGMEWQVRRGEERYGKDWQAS